MSDSYVKTQVLWWFLISNVSSGKCEIAINEPSREKTNNVVSDQVRHNSGCTGTEAG